MPRQSGDRLRAYFWWGSVKFDGHVLTVTRLWRPRWRPRTTRYPVADLAHADFHLVGESERGWWTITRRCGAEDKMYITARKGDRLSGVTHAVTLTAFWRTAMILEDTVGFGPWPDDVWQRILTLSPGMDAVRAPTREMRYMVPQGTPQPSEAELVLAGLRAPGPPPRVHINRHSWFHALRRINSPGPWAVLLDGLRAGHEPTTDPRWPQIAAAALAADPNGGHPYGRPTTDTGAADT